jgi:hypothetical protein
MELNEKYLLCIAHALYSTRLHVLTLTEVVRHKVQPDEDGLLRLPPALDEEMRNQAFDYLLAMFPPEVHPSLLSERPKWLTQQ